ncbi:MAG: hypothetical protein AB1427_19670 [Thermodesulfobacteriota bacterium]
MAAFKRWIVILLTALFMISITACGEESTMEKLGKKADRAVEDTKKTIKKFGN